MKIPTKTLCIGCTAAFLSGGTAWAQEACSTYVVAPGDNLRYIARNAYGDADMYRVIYSANVDTIGAKADLIEIGVSLAIPCDPREETVTAAAPSVGLQTEVIDPAKQPVEVVPDLPVGDAGLGGSEVVVQEPAPEPAPEPEPVEVAAATPEAPPEVPATKSKPPMAFPYRLVTGNGYAPFADEFQTTVLHRKTMGWRGHCGEFSPTCRLPQPGSEELAAHKTQPTVLARSFAV